MPASRNPLLRPSGALHGALELELSTRRATTRLARLLAAHLQVGDMLLLSGPLGVGKTFFARALLRGLGVGFDTRVTSPSFALVHDYEGHVPILHVDLYRLSSPHEVEQLGLRQRRDDALLIVEWGSRYRSVLGDDGFELTLDWAERGRVARLAAMATSGQAVLDAVTRAVGPTRGRPEPKPVTQGGRNERN